MGIFSLFDIILFTIIGISTLLAFFKGAVKCTIQLIRTLSALLCTLYLLPYTTSFLSQKIAHPLVVSFCAYTAPFIIFFILFSIISHYLLKLVDPIRDGAIDASLGAFYGFVRGCLIGCAVYMSVSLVVSALQLHYSDKKHPTVEIHAEKQPKWLRKGFTYHLLTMGNQWLLTYLPEKQWSRLENTLRIMHATNQAAHNSKETVISSNTLKTLFNYIPRDSSFSDHAYDALLQYKPGHPMTKAQQQALQELINRYERAQRTKQATPDQTLPADQLHALKNLLRITPTDVPSTDQINDGSNIGYDMKQLEQLNELFTDTQTAP